MNGVRRLWGGGRSTSPATTSQAPHPDSALAASTPVTTAAIATNPPSPPQASPPTSPLVDEPFANTPGLVIRKDKTGRKPIAPRTVAGGNTTTSPSSSLHSHSTSLGSQLFPDGSFPNGGSDLEWKRTSSLVDIRDKLLMSLLTSEAVVDSRNCEILSAEEVEELKKEHHILKIRLAAAGKKLNLETKIRDAALSLSRVNAAHKKVSKQTEEQLETAERKVATAQKEYWRVSERASEVHRKLLEHRAGVLGYSVQSIEKKANPFANESVEQIGITPNHSPSPSSVSYHTTSNVRFDGAHLFAGHADAQVPRLPPSLSDVATLETKLHAATQSLNAANKQQAEMALELQQLRLEKEQMESTMNAERRRAEETVAALEEELPRFEELQSKYDELLKEKSLWEGDKTKLLAREQEVERLERRLELLEEKSGEASEMEKILADVQQKTDAEFQQKEISIASLKQQLLERQEQWEIEKEAMEEIRLAEVSTLQEEIEALRVSTASQVRPDEVVAMLHELMQYHEVEYSVDDRSLEGTISSLSAHLESLSEALEDLHQERTQWESTREHLESKLQTYHEQHEMVSGECKSLRRELDEAKHEVAELESRTKAFNAPSVYTGPPIEYKGEVADVVALLQTAWAVLPAPELRATKLNTRRHLRATSTASSPGGQSKSGLPSLSEMDVRSLKALYDAKSPQAAVGGNFSVEAFVARVQALVIDDRALIERLIRFAQAHDMLKKNAERAQKLAQDSNAALETYQRQVVALDNQNHILLTRQAALMNEIEELRAAVESATADKREIETHAAEQAETCRQLTEANNALSAKTLALAQEAATAPEAVRKQFDAQLTECKEKLRQAEEEIHAMQTSEQSQRIALLDELNSMQTENANLRAQLRAVKK
ncbi:hypothetical protein ID866_6867 [Astraeus odoratus]|nr:hypothetical protein ID866_6867 [Astraeus odoratus]